MVKRESETRAMIMTSDKSHTISLGSALTDRAGRRHSANRPVSHNGTMVAIKQSSDNSLKNRSRIVLCVSAIFAAMGCGNTGVGAMDAGRDVMGDVVEYGVNFRPPNNRYCAQIEASATPVYGGSEYVYFCRPDAPAGTRCAGMLAECLPIQRFSPDLEGYARTNRVPQLCTQSVGFLAIERCDLASPRGCTDGTFCALIRHRITEEVMPACVPYPCNP